ncbi:MAG: type II toxin-antitoxin system Phd/YefM family antitoxin [Burkholderiales bacterium]
MEISAVEFKAQCLKLMDQVARTRETVIITKRGKPVAKLIPADEIKRRLFGCMAGTVTYEGDIVSPIAVEGAALSGPAVKSEGENHGEDATLSSLE